MRSLRTSKHKEPTFDPFLSFLENVLPPCSSLIGTSQDGASAKYPPIVFRDFAKYESLLSASA